MRLRDFKKLITTGRVYDVVNNTFKPELNDSERIVDKAQGNGWFYRVTSATEDRRYWCDMPKANEIAASSSDGFGGVIVTLLIPTGPGLLMASGARHSVTLKFFLEAGEEL